MTAKVNEGRDANTGRLDTQVSSRNTTTLFSNNLDYSLAGRISQDARIGAGRQYAYDGAGRLTSATDTPSGVSRSYGFDANSNRCANATTCGSPTFSYNPGDQLTSSPYGSGYVYDTYGNLDTYAKTGGGTVNLDYDSFDHTIRIDDGTTRVDSVLSPDGRVLRRTVSSPPGVTITEDRRYGYTDSSDSPAWSQATSGGAYTTYLSNLVVTGTTPSYQLSDPKGTVVGTVTQAGAFSATPIPDEYGNIATVPASRLDWLGTQRRFVDHPGLDIVRMGVRAYDPHLGRFLSQDPIVGGSANDYDYVNADPINGTDLGGTCGVWGAPWRKCRRGHRGQRGFLGGSFSRTYRRRTIGVSLCAVACVSGRFQGGRAAVSAGCCTVGVAPASVNIGQAGITASARSQCSIFASASAALGVYVSAGLRSSPGGGHEADFRDWEVGVAGPKFALGFGATCDLASGSLPWR